VVGCSSGGGATRVDAGASATSAAPVSTTSSTTSSSPTSSTTALVTASSVVLRPHPELAVSVYWTRAYGDPRRVSVDGYTDPSAGPLPYVLFGSVSNAGSSTVTAPAVTFSFPPSTASYAARIVTPSGGDVADLAPGATADVLLVVADPSAAALSDLTPVPQGVGQ